MKKLNQMRATTLARIASWMLVATTALAVSSCTEDPEEPGLNLNPGTQKPGTGGTEVVSKDNFSTGGYVIYHVRTGNFGDEEKSIISAAVDGTIMCHNKDGVLKWRNSDYVKNMPFDVELADIDGDGYDEVFVAKAGGVIEAYDDTGEQLWEYTTATQGNIFQVRAAKTENGSWQIYAGGVGQMLYIFHANSGEVAKEIYIRDVIRSIVYAHVESADKKTILVNTVCSGLGGGSCFYTIDPETLESKKAQTLIWDNEYKQKAYTLLPMDVDGDGIDEFYASGDGGNLRKFTAYDESTILKGEFSVTSSKVPGIAYRMTFIHDVELDGERRILGQYGGYLIIYDLEGNVKEVIKSKKDYANSYYDADTKILYLTSSVSGGDGIYRLNLAKSNWRTTFEKMEYVGMMSSVEKNIAELDKQIEAFNRPAYQTKAPTDITLIGSGAYYKKKFGNIHYVNTKIMTEKFPEDKEQQLWSQGVKAEGNYTYNTPQEEILDYARTCESKKEYFTMWGCHGTDMFMSQETMEKIIDVAPNYFVGFTLTEMETLNNRMKRIVTEIIRPVTDKCKANGKKIIFWNKNIFWCGSCYYDFWESYLFDPEYADTIVPALEETNSRTQEMALAANVGLWSTGYFKSWSCRIVTDNTSFDRMWEWSSQQSPSLYYRQIAINASYGANVLYTDVNQGELASYVKDQLIPVHQFLSKGVVIIPETAEESLSMSSVCLGMTTPPSTRYLNSGKNGHGYSSGINVDAAPMVFDRMDAFWGAAPMLDHDFSKYGYGCEERYLNFLPRLPYGMVPIVPSHTDLSSHAPLTEMVETDGEYFYEGGVKKDAVSYKSTMITKLQEAASKMVVKVVGDVSWSATKIDNKHFRLILADYGYIEPADREVTIMLRNIEPVWAKNILTGEKYTMSDGVFTMTVPAGVFSAIDVEYN